MTRTAMNAWRATRPFDESVDVRLTHRDRACPWGV